MKSFPHDSRDHDRVYSSSDFRDYFIPFVTNGVFANPANSCMVMAGEIGRIVTVKAGRCFINGCVGYTDGTETILIPSADMYFPRYDLITVRLDLERRDIHIQLIQGTPEDDPEYPPIERSALVYDIVLAAIKSDPTEYDITQAAITDLRFDDRYCGIVSGLVNQISTTDLFAQYQKTWDDFVSKLGKDDHITIDTADHKVRADIVAVKSQLPFDISLKSI